NNAASDFYAIGVSSDSTYFNSYDALAPWLQTTSFNATANGVYSDSYTHAQYRHEDLVHAVASYPGRLVYGGVTPGFDDWTRNWSGPCQERTMPSSPYAARDPNF